MHAAAEDAGISAAGVSALVADVQRQVTALEAAQAAADAVSARSSESAPETVDDGDMPADEDGIERIAQHFAEQARREQV